MIESSWFSERRRGGRGGKCWGCGASAENSVRPGSDLMVDALKSVGIEFVMAKPGSSFEGLQESIINYGKDDMEFITACAPRDPNRRRPPVRLPPCQVMASQVCRIKAAHMYACIRSFKPTQPATKDIRLLNQRLSEGGKLGAK